MTTTYLGFLMNRQSKEEFVAPVVAADIVTAKVELMKAFPESRYQFQTMYSRNEMDYVLAGIDRWPGVASKVQPPLTTDLSKVTARTGGLPPLPGQATSATVEKVEANTQAMPAWMQGFIQQQAGKPAPAQLSQVQTTATPQPSMQAMLAAMNQTKATTPQPLPAQPQSLIERLKAAKGEVIPKTSAMPVETLQSVAKPGSVIDILKGMRK